MKRLLFLAFLFALVPSLHATIWYVRSDGGTRYDATYNTSGQCNGKSDAAYPGSGANQPCAYNDDRWLWSDNNYTTTATCPHWCWVGTGGDTYMIRDCVQYSAPGTPIPGSSGSCRYGYSGPNSGDHFLAIAGDPFSSGMPPPPSGTSGAHTKILGYNYASCTSAGAKTQIHGGYGASTVMAFGGANYVDVACFDITDWSSCGRAGQVNGCSTSYPLTDYATNGIGTNNTTTNVTFTDMNIHGLGSAGMIGPTGDGVTVTRVVVSGNASSGWNMDAGDGTTGTGHLNFSYFSTIFNGCSEVYPITTTIAVPGYSLNGGTIGQVGDCTDDNGGGYGDGIGTATVTSSPAWIMIMDHSIAAYNTQDGFDLLHLQGGGSTITISNSTEHSNMGQQIKIGSAGVAYNNQIVGNCNALRQSIPGLPAGYNTHLSDFCRAADAAAVMSITSGATTKWLFNTFYSATQTGLEVQVNGTCDSTCYLQYENNIFLGFTNNSANGYPSGGTGNNSNPIYFDSINPFPNAGSTYAHNATYHQSASFPCPNTGSGETSAICTDPGLTDETWRLYGMGNMTPATGAVVIGAGLTIAGITTDINGVTRPSPPTIGAYETGAIYIPTKLSGTIKLSGTVKLQ